VGFLLVSFHSILANIFRATAKHLFIISYAHK
jgi:hypothetical protein